MFEESNSKLTAAAVSPPASLKSARGDPTALNWRPVRPNGLGNLKTGGDCLSEHYSKTVAATIIDNEIVKKNR